MALPNLVIAGAPKCGTSSIFRWLADHPDAEGSSVKETRYFIDPDSHVFDPSSNYATGGLARYEQFFTVNKPRAAVRLEATPVYLFQKSALKALPDIPTNPRFLFLVREPSRQILSTYRYFTNNWRYLDARIPFAEFLDMVQAGDKRLRGNELLARALDNARFEKHLIRWRDRVGPARMRVMLLEDVQAAEQAALTGLASWLRLDPDFYRDYGFPRENETYRARSQTLQAVNLRLRGLIAKTPLYEPARRVYRRLNTSPEARPLDDRDMAAAAALKLSYAEDNARLADMFDLDLRAWDDEGATA